MKAETFFYLVTRGRNSGLPRRQETSFVELGGQFYLLAESRSVDWLKNIQADSRVSFSIGNRRDATSGVSETAGSGRLVDDVVESELCARVRASMHAKYRWTTGLIVEIARLPD